MKKDDVYNKEMPKVSDFVFNQIVAEVFDDMVIRSVPFYQEIQRMVGELAARYAKDGTNIYDLGCSTGNTIISMALHVNKNVTIVGIDDSADMLKKCDEKLKTLNIPFPYHLIQANLKDEPEIENASVAVLCLTLQFVRPLYRHQLLEKIYRGLNPGGVLILVEKILTEHQIFNRDFIDFYYDFKRRNHYSELEISQKREALENVLIPYKLSENLTLLSQSGFASAEVFFKWYNFAGIIAIKE
ncbi:MAG: carboxy-S-adenosyl-L-methionine synthase CmoA [Chitinophagaceae bacterium]|nr:carboxy-S-adenosyl-L-methionine synthase CmoA [Chitinophagaceae bacterium]